MGTAILNLSAVLLYSSAGAVLFRRLTSTRGEKSGRTSILWISLAAVLIHALILYATLSLEDQWSMGMTNAFSLIACAVAAIFTLLAFLRPVENLGVAVMPAAALAVLGAWIWPAESQVLVTPSRQFTLHLVLSVMAYAFLTLAVVQAILLSTQERRLRHREPGRVFKALPPIQTMETVLFMFTGIGFVLLTLTLISGAIYTRSLTGVAFAFNHHTVLTFLAWSTFGILLSGHFFFGWRGRQAVHWTIGGFVILVLAYFGTKYVVEFVLS
jgi:ABC-type uncharacterized transport system permease subunit